MTVPLVTGTKSSPWVSVGKNVIIIREVGIAHTEKFLHVVKVDSFNLKVMSEKIKTDINGNEYKAKISLTSEQSVLQ